MLENLCYLEFSLDQPGMHFERTQRSENLGTKLELYVDISGEVPMFDYPSNYLICSEDNKINFADFLIQHGKIQSKYIVLNESNRIVSIEYFPIPSSENCKFYSVPICPDLDEFIRLNGGISNFKILDNLFGVSLKDLATHYSRMELIFYLEFISGSPDLIYYKRLEYLKELINLTREQRIHLGVSVLIGSKVIRFTGFDEDYEQLDSIDDSVDQITLINNKNTYSLNKDELRIVKHDLHALKQIENVYASAYYHYLSSVIKILPMLSENCLIYGYMNNEIHQIVDDILRGDQECSI